MMQSITFKTQVNEAVRDCLIASLTMIIQTFNISCFTWTEIVACCKDTESLVAKIGRLDFILVFVVIACTVVDLDNLFTLLKIHFKIVVVIRYPINNKKLRKIFSLINFKFSPTKTLKLPKILIPFIQIPQKVTNFCLCRIKFQNKEICSGKSRSKKQQQKLSP